jgi:hypothetical protein
MSSKIDVEEHYAYPKEFVNLETVMRFSAVKRWHMVETRKVQTLAEHSALVAALAFVIAQESPGMFFGGCSFAAAYALFHDIPEVFTGDPPTPTKKHCTGLKELESALTPKAFRWMASSNLELMVKLCDLADSIRHIRLHGVDLTAEHARRGLEEQLFNKLTVAGVAWPREVYAHVLENIWFYAYETRNRFAAGHPLNDAWPVADDLARERGDQPGGPGPVICDAGRGPLRDGVDGTEGGAPKVTPAGPPAADVHVDHRTLADNLVRIT